MATKIYRQMGISGGFSSIINALQPHALLISPTETFAHWLDAQWLRLSNNNDPNLPIVSLCSMREFQWAAVLDYILLRKIRSSFLLCEGINPVAITTSVAYMDLNWVTLTPIFTKIISRLNDAKEDWPIWRYEGNLTDPENNFDSEEYRKSSLKIVKEISYFYHINQKRFAMGVEDDWKRAMDKIAGFPERITSQSVVTNLKDLKTYFEIEGLLSTFGYVVDLEFGNVYPRNVVPYSIVIVHKPMLWLAESTFFNERGTVLNSLTGERNVLRRSDYFISFKPLNNLDDLKKSLPNLAKIFPDIEIHLQEENTAELLELEGPIAEKFLDDGIIQEEGNSLVETNLLGAPANMKPGKKVIFDEQVFASLMRCGTRFANASIPPEQWRMVMGVFGGFSTENFVFVEIVAPIAYGNDQHVQFDPLAYGVLSIFDTHLSEMDRFMVGWFHSRFEPSLHLSMDDIKNQIGWQGSNPDAFTLVFNPMLNVGNPMMPKFEVHSLKDVKMKSDDPQFINNIYKVDYEIEAIFNAGRTVNLHSNDFYKPFIDLFDSVEKSRELVKLHANYIQEFHFIRDAVILVADINPENMQQLLIFKQIDPMTRGIIFEDRLECIHTVVARIPCEEYERVMEDPELEEEYRRHPSKFKSTDRFLREGEDITSINLELDEKFFAFKSWVQGIAEAGIDALKLQSEIDNLLRNSLPIAQFLFRNMMRVDSSFIDQFLDKIEKECRFEGVYHKPSLRANLIIILDSIYFRVIEEGLFEEDILGTEAIDKKNSGIIETLLRINELDSEILFEYGDDEFLDFSDSVNDFRRIIAERPEFTSFLGFGILLVDKDMEVRRAALKNLYQMSDELEVVEGYHFLRKMYEQILQRISKILEGTPYENYEDLDYMEDDYEDEDEWDVGEHRENEDERFFTKKKVRYTRKEFGEFEKLSRDITFALGGLHLTHGEFELAMNCYETYQKFAEERNDVEMLADIFNNIGYIHYLRGDYDKAEQNYLKAKEKQKYYQKGDKNIYLWCNLGYLDLVQGRFEKAEENFELSCDLAKQSDNTQMIVENLIGRGDTLQKTSKLEDASEEYKQAMIYAKELPHSILRAKLLNSMGSLHFALGNYKEAIKTYEEALEINNRLIVPYESMLNLQGLGMTYQKMNDYANAAVHLKQALKICQDLHLTNFIDSIKKQITNLPK